jgi:hypothetical protein
MKRKEKCWFTAMATIGITLQATGYRDTKTATFTYFKRSFANKTMIMLKKTRSE